MVQGEGGGNGADQRTKSTKIAMTTKILMTRRKRQMPLKLWKMEPMTRTLRTPQTQFEEIMNNEGYDDPCELLY